MRQKPPAHAWRRHYRLTPARHRERAKRREAWRSTTAGAAEKSELYNCTTSITMTVR
jgi:hypothetical protein